MSSKSLRRKRNSEQESQLVKILSVKATEENSTKLLKPMAVSSANISAIGAKSDEEFISKRASYLFALLPDSVQLLLTVNKFPGDWIKFTLLISFVIGLLSNYLGPTQLIHVVYNPLTILLAWTALIYVLMILKRFLKIRGLLKIDIRKKKNESETVEEDAESPKEKPSSFILDWLIGGIYKGIIQMKAKFVDDNATLIVRPTTAL